MGDELIAIVIKVRRTYSRMEWGCKERLPRFGQRNGGKGMGSHVLTFLCLHSLAILLGIVQPAEDVVEIAVGVEAVVEFEVSGDVLGRRFIEDHNADVFIDACVSIDAATKIACLTGGSKASAGWLFAIVAKEPRFAADDDDSLGLICLIRSPLRPVFGRSTRFGIKKKLIEDHADATRP